MAKGSLIGVKSGKLGDIVMYPSNGKQGMRIYRDTIKNPRTPGQLQVRAKMNLAGRISKIVSKQMIAGLGQGTAGKNRNAFMKSLIKSATVTRNTDNTGYIAGIAPESIIFATGAAQLPAGVKVGFGFAGSQSASNEVVVHLLYDATVTQEMMDNFSARAIILAINTKTNEFDICATALVNKPTIAAGSTGGYVDTTIKVDGVNDHVLFGYIVPMAYSSEEATIAATSFLGTQLSSENATQIMAELIDRGATLSSMVYGTSTLKQQDNAGDMTDVMISRLANGLARGLENAGELQANPSSYANIAPMWPNIMVPGNGCGLPTTPGAQIDTNNLLINWSESAEAKPDDKLQVVIWNETKQQIVTVKDAATVEDTRFQYECPGSWVGDDIEVYGFFSNAEGTATSKSVYMGHFSL